MADVLWWLQATGAAVSLFLLLGGFLTGLYAAVRGTPKFLRRLTGADRIERKLEALRGDHMMSQELQLQQAEAFNELQKTVCDEHEIPPGNRPPGMNTGRIREEFMDRERHEFTRGGPSTD